MDLELPLPPLQFGYVLTAALLAAFVAGLAGFAFGLIAAGLWLYVLTPLQMTTLIVALGLLVQGAAVWRLRRAIRLSRLWPFLIGAVLGAPLGAELLRWADPATMRRVVGLSIALFALYSLARPKLPATSRGGRAADGGVGALSGALGGATGLGGILPTIWCGLRGWPKDEQRAVFQPTAVAVFLMTLAWLGGAGEFGRDTAVLLAAGAPVTLVGTWLGLRAFGRLDEAAFRKVVLWLLLSSGAVLAFT